MLLKYVYSSTKNEFTLSPLTTSTQTCRTTDFINCNTAADVGGTCETSDGIKCGGTQAFIFAGTLPGYPSSVFFQAKTGTINWQDGYALSADNSLVQYAALRFTMIASDGSIFTGKATCVSDAQ